MLKFIKSFPFKLLFIFILFSFISGCTQKVKNVNDTVRLAIQGSADIHKSPYEVTQLPYASTYVRIGNNNQLFMVLAFAETPAGKTITHSNKNNPPQLKWLASDNGMLITQSGRIIKTVNLSEGNLLTTHSTSPDPLSLGLHLATTPKQWQRTIDWQPGYHTGYQLDSNFVFDHAEVLTINGKSVPVLRFNENVLVKQLNKHYRNTFWIEQQTGKVVKSLQYIAPSLPRVEMTILKPFN
ncbi:MULTISPECIES: YjbF family lipoprotein [Photobacterium]|uniref:YjbF family lipoprotein n=1 Tax=Photobacterium TaxID=657 RepID=UPI001E3C7633|nr:MULTISPECIES: YjbF family lipoprotein [Photobacterium]MCD9477016.1 YjbF family lipoprotein [Photobacterium phosphoreum]MCD9486599.1 YjbF family lipoprotein [Photobacterium iliopiscarium]MCD9508532.1 YjbF family lipoprotein [Photobacterium phosphoreum]MCD9529083.1 YjbF family lipoprotein [Photobacterium carnosum]MCD9539157.1 YjbF family lipoprotein [Photobacterium carnosum]